MAFRIVFVCTGNICRSPTAEALMRHHAGALPIIADSCGTSAEETGNPPDPLTVAELRARGVAVPERRARRVNLADFKQADWLVAMTRDHEATLRRQQPDHAKAQIHRLTSFIDGPTPDDVSDPWFAGTRAAHAEAFELIEQGVLAIVAHLRPRLG